MEHAIKHFLAFGIYLYWLFHDFSNRFINDLNIQCKFN